MRSFALGTALIVFLDHLAKWYFDRWLELGESVVVIPGFWNFTLVYNRGAAFGMLAGLDDFWRIALFGAIALIAFILCAQLARHGSGAERLAATAIAGGALGNLIDRLGWGYVIDYVDWHYAGWHWPAFNIADVAISLGAVIYIGTLWRAHRRQSHCASAGGPS